MRLLSPKAIRIRCTHTINCFRSARMRPSRKPLSNLLGIQDLQVKCDSIMKKNSCFVGFLAIAIFVAACTSLPETQPRLRLPEGDPKKGQATFVELECHACHGVEDLDLPPYTGTSPASVKLGGWYVRVKTYEELITSIIHPSHELIAGYDETEIAIDGESVMPIFNDEMTVTQLIDLVAFLQEKYGIFPPESYAEYKF